jgi:hypothetical protein
MTTTADTLRIFCVNKDLGTGEHYATDLEPDWTIDELTEGLIADGYLSAPTGGEKWLVHHARTGRDLPGRATLAEAGVADGDQLTFHRKSHGAGTLTAEELLGRARYDARGAAAFNDHSFPATITGHYGIDEARAGSTRPVPLQSEDPPTAYRMTCSFPTISAPNRPLREVVFAIDPRAKGDYPATEPVAEVVSRPVPFVPHIGANGAVCHGHFVWIPFRTELTEYFAQLCRLLNYDEPAPTARFTAMNYAAVKYWRSIGHRALDPDLHPPVILLSVRHTRRRPLSRASTGTGAPPRRSLTRVHSDAATARPQAIRR